MGKVLPTRSKRPVKAAGGNVVARECGTNNWKAILTPVKSRQPDGTAFTGGDTQAAAFVQRAQTLGQGQARSRR
ncbi:hypothetical protein [Paraburkholderia caledonica]|uniref:Uncharacterized protein n=1 Tax=Paraburkholderia caledonica TaxID=134536 RepID=A0AB73ILV4_9BURK|nr:hypothetical protein [Paraburkholderia caledonica]